MSLTFIPSTAGHYQCLSTDIAANKVTGASYIGATLYTTDTGLWYRILPDYTLAPLSPIGQAKGATSNDSFGRPTDTTPYSIKDVVNLPTPGLMTFDNVVRVAGGTFYIVKARLVTSLSTNTASYRLHLYDVDTITPIADNAPFTLLMAGNNHKIGYIDFAGTSTEGAGSDIAESINSTVRLYGKCDAADTAIYGVLQVLDAQTPSSAQIFDITLEIEQE